jgi:transposase
MEMQDALVPDLFWEQIHSVLPVPTAGAQGGRPRVDDRSCLAGILYVLRTGCPWGLLPALELGCGSYSTCWRRFRDWTAAGVWPVVHRRWLEALASLGQIDVSLIVIDSASVRALFGGRTPAQALRIGRKKAVNAM